MINARLYLSIIICCLLFLLQQTDLVAQLSEKDSIAYIKEIEQYRNGINRKFKKDPKPLTDSDRKKFKKLSFFSIGTKYCVDGIFTRTLQEDTFKMETTTKWRPDFVKYGTITFTIDSIEYTLAAYQNVREAKLEDLKNNLFIPFADNTNGRQTYEGGRYIDSKIPGDEHIKLDFNKAYIPWCVYNSRFSCPIPPEENALPIEIAAGEKDYGY